MKHNVYKGLFSFRLNKYQALQIASANRKNALVWKCVIDMATPITISSPCTPKLCVIPFHTTDFSQQRFRQPLWIRVWTGHVVDWSHFVVSSACVHHHLKYCPWYLLPFNELCHRCNSLEPWMTNSGILQLLSSTVSSCTELSGHGGLKPGEDRQGKMLRWNFHLYHYHMQVQCHRIQAWSSVF